MLLGLYIQLQVNRAQYTSIVDSLGMRLVVKSPREFPFPGNEGFNVPIGFETAITLKYTELQYLGEPYNPCVTAPNSWYNNEGEYSNEVGIFDFTFAIYLRRTTMSDM